jgi:site-specific DNA-cytosine methylase
MDRETRDGRNHWDFAHHSDTEKGKSAAVVANFLKGVPYNVLIDQRRTRCSFWSCDFQLQDEDFCSECIGEDGNISSYQCENFPTPVVRKFTPVECERLQTLPDNYTQGVSNTQRYKMLGNAWTVDVVAHILSYLPSKYKTN